MRRDGSNRFGSNYLYGTFPGVSMGWNVDQEAFWPSNNIINSLKVRGGFGVTGNDGLPDYKFLALVAVGENYTIGNNVQNGYAPLTLENPDLRWEETNQINIGFEATLLNNLDLTFEFFNKKTSGILRQRTIPGYVGVTELPWDNIADMENKGIELELKYRRNFGPVHFSGSGVFSTLKNTVTYVASDYDWIDGNASFQTMSTVTRTQVGQSYNAWFGYKTNGIFQTQEDIDSYTNSNGEPIQPNARPGDFRWVDVNGDGQITNDDQDKTFLGTSLPKYTFGITLNFEYKGFDFMVFANGVAGNKIFQGLRRLDISKANYQTAVLDRWTGPGTSNDYPRLSTADPNGNFSRMSDFYLQKGDFLRFRIIQFGYTMPQNDFFGKLGISKFRVYVTGENLFTFTKYTGYDPEIGGGVFGVDKGQYPQARSFLFGAQIQL
jgi:TonB-linked SusC/RagA family outer membrane protein